MGKWKYTVLFPAKSPRAPKKAELDELLELLAGQSAGTGDLPAGYTYFGQFAVHDVSSLQPRHPTPIKRLFSLNKPALDLDSIYGQGLARASRSAGRPPAGRGSSRVPFDRATGMFVLDPAGSGANAEKDRDLPRNALLQASIGDGRNDENLLIAQMQVLFMRFHNRIVHDLRTSGVRGPKVLFERARKEVVKAYQYLVLHDLTKKLVPEAVYAAVVLQGRGALSTPNAAAPTIALEFVDAACRLHSLVRSSYALNDRRTVNFTRMRELTGHEQPANASKPLLQRDDVVDWRFFFEFANYPQQQRPWQRANAISVVLNPFMRKLQVHKRKRIDMLKTNITTAVKHRLCTGQEACEALQKQLPALAKELDLRRIDVDNRVLSELKRTNSIRTRTPLWLYMMLEAASGRMGVLGGWIIADALRTAALNSTIRLTDLSQTQPTELYKSLRNLARNRQVTIEDVIRYTYH